jgi:hypothetical protein
MRGYPTCLSWLEKPSLGLRQRFYGSKSANRKESNITGGSTGAGVDVSF